MNDKQLLVSGTALSVLALALAGSSMLTVNSLSKSVQAASVRGQGTCASTTARPCYELQVGPGVLLPETAGEQLLSKALSTLSAALPTTLCPVWGSEENIIVAFLTDNIVWGTNNNDDRTLLKFTGSCSGNNIVWGD